jgi:Raf kinase inhibitor-like YbhB/YbcL family protein
MPASVSPSGGNKSPELNWAGAPRGTVSFALLVEDPDGGNWSHWVVYDMAAGVQGLDENVPKTGDLSGGGKQGTNSWGQIGWGGPTPPSGTHHYYFRLYALDTMLNLPSGATLSQVRKAMQGHILDTAELMGTYRAG